MGRITVVVVCTVILGAALLLQSETLTSLAIQNPATPPPAAPAVITSEVFAQVAPATVSDARLGLARVTIMPGAAIPTHYHPGTQIGFIAQGELTYEVFRGEVLWYHGNDADGEPDVIGPDETVLARSGDTVVEPPGSIHQGRNEGDSPITIYLSTLFPAGAPRSIAAEATPPP